ncbi:ANR family transcriptional regulator [Citrobacter braakii]|nr:ANR family transcriptional regulator [Citrobacter braakii]
MPYLSTETEKTIRTALSQEEQKQSESVVVQAGDDRVKRNMTFRQVSIAARSSERQCDFALAAVLWTEAYEKAHKEVNRVWAQKRSELCQLMGSYQTPYERQKLPECCIRHSHKPIHCRRLLW